MCGGYMFESDWADFFAFEDLPRTPLCLAPERVTSLCAREMAPWEEKSWL